MPEKANQIKYSVIAQSKTQELNVGNEQLSGTASGARGPFHQEMTFEMVANGPTLTVHSQC